MLPAAAVYVCVTGKEEHKWLERKRWKEDEWRGDRNTDRQIGGDTMDEEWHIATCLIGCGEWKSSDRAESSEWTSVEGAGLQTAVWASVNGFPVIPAVHTDSHTAAVWAGANPTTQWPQGTTGAATVSFSLPLEGSLTLVHPKHKALPKPPNPKAPTALAEGATTGYTSICI